MLKNILLSGLLCTFLSAESFDIFLQKAIKNSPYLESWALAVQQAKQKGIIQTRYENPTLEMEYASFNPDSGSSDNGYRLNYSQPIRLWGIADAKNKFSKNIIKSSTAIYTQQQAIFKRDISLAFTSFSQAKKLVLLGKEELEIAKTIYDISKARYDSGTISRGLMLQAKIDYETIQINNEALSLSSNQSYFQLLKFAGIK